MDVMYRHSLDFIRDFLDVVEEDLDGMSIEDRVDVGARLNVTSKALERIDVRVKKYVSDLLQGEPGSVNGEMFRAELKVIEADRLNLDQLKEQYRHVYDECSRATTQVRISFKAR